MSTPVATDDLVQGAVKWLLTNSAVSAAVSVYPGTDTPYLFQHQLWVEMEGTGSTAAVLSYGGGFAGPNNHNTMRFLRLMLDVYADPVRDAGRNVTEPGEVHRRVTATYLAFDAVLHRPDPTPQYWGTLRVIGSARLVEPSIAAVADGDGLLRLTTGYAVVQA